MDADGQHPGEAIGRFMALSQQHPQAMILGAPIFDASAPALRVKGRRVSNWWTNLETLWNGIDDSLFGFRVYPIEPLVRIMQRQRWMRRYDFDVEAAVRLDWADQRGHAGALPERRAGRHLALQLPARQPAADRHACAADGRLRAATADAAGAAHAAAMSQGSARGLVAVYSENRLIST